MVVKDILGHKYSSLDLWHYMGTRYRARKELEIMASVPPVRVVTQVRELVLPSDVNPAHGAGVSSSPMSVHPLIDAVVVESVAAGVEPL